MNEINQKLDIIIDFMQVLIRQKITDKQFKLQEEIKDKGWMEVKDTMRFLNISRTHALTLMKKVGEIPGFMFRVGDRQMSIASKVIFNQSRIIQDQYQKVHTLLLDKGQVTFHDIMKQLDLDLPAAKSFAYDFQNSTEGVMVKDSNKLVKHC